MISTEHLGPVDYVVVAFPDGEVRPAGFRALLDLVDRGAVYVIDIEFVVKSDTGLTRVAAHEFGAVDGLDFSEFDGAATGVLDDADIDTMGAGLSIGGIAAVVVYEELSMAAAVAAWEREGATIVADGPVDSADLIAALDALDESAHDDKS